MAAPRDEPAGSPGDRALPIEIRKSKIENLRLLAAAARLPSRVLLLLIRLYQRALSPVLPIVTLGQCACRFTPTCSHYAAEAVRTHGAWFGTGLAVRRLLKCTPLHPGGEDPVPPVHRRACRSAGFISQAQPFP